MTTTYTPADLNGLAGTTRAMRLAPHVRLRTPDNPVRIISDSGQEFVETYRLDAEPGTIERGWVPPERPDRWVTHHTPRTPYRTFDGSPVSHPLPYENPTPQPQPTFVTSRQAGA